MSTASLTSPQRANFDSARPCAQRRRALRLNSQVMQKSRSIFPIKTAQHLSDITGYSHRAVQNWLSGKVVLPADALAALIQSEWGRDFLVATMCDATPKWWVLLNAWIKRVTYEAAAAMQARKLRELLNEEAKAYPTAMLLQDEAFYSGQPTPSRALAKRGK